MLAVLFLYSSLDFTSEKPPKIPQNTSPPKKKLLAFHIFAAIQMFLERRRVHMFTDWAYEHATFMGTESYGHRGVKCLWFGGLVLGTGAAAADQSEAIERFWHLARMPPCRGASKAMRPCLSLGAASNSSTSEYVLLSFGFARIPFSCSNLINPFL